ncbi:MAG: exodeoxyribonuclease VII small subunit [Pseudomonadota bacterium]
MATKRKTPDLDTALTELETLVKTMESGDLSLDEAMKTFERGVELTRDCQTALKQAEQKVDILMKKTAADGGIEPFED